MDFDYLSFLSFIMFFVCFISMGYIALRYCKSQLPYTTISCYGIWYQLYYPVPNELESR